MVTQRTKRRVLFLLVSALLSGCSASLHRAELGQASPVTDWDGLSTLFRSGKVYFGGQPTADALRAAPERGIKVVVNLRSTPEVEALEFDEPALVAQLGMQYASIPVSLATFGPSDADHLRTLLSETPGPVLIHCASSNRVGAVWALYLHRHRDVPLGDAIEHGRSAGLRSETLVEAVKRASMQ